jgi:hypothetical protein
LRRRITRAGHRRQCGDRHADCCDSSHACSSSNLLVGLP